MHISYYGPQFSDVKEKSSKYSEGDSSVFLLLTGGCVASDLTCRDLSPFTSNKQEACFIAGLFCLNFMSRSSDCISTLSIWLILSTLSHFSPVALIIANLIKIIIPCNLRLIKWLFVWPYFMRWVLIIFKYILQYKPILVGLTSWSLKNNIRSINIKVVAISHFNR